MDNWARRVAIKVLRFRQRPQLRMEFPNDQKIVRSPLLPVGYRSRNFTSGDEVCWAKMLNANGQLGAWNISRVTQIIEDQPDYLGQQFVCFQNTLVACAGAYLRYLDGSVSWEIGQVATAPDHAGKGLGVHITSRAISHAKSVYRSTPIYLLTDEFRIPAIKMYLRLGFVPSNIDQSSVRKQWNNVADALETSDSKLIERHFI